MVHVGPLSTNGECWDVLGKLKHKSSRRFSMETIHKSQSVAHLGAHRATPPKSPASTPGQHPTEHPKTSRKRNQKIIRTAICGGIWEWFNPDLNSGLQQTYAQSIALETFVGVLHGAQNWSRGNLPIPGSHPHTPTVALGNNSSNTASRKNLSCFNVFKANYKHYVVRGFH